MVPVAKQERLESKHLFKKKLQGRKAQIQKLAIDASMRRGSFLSVKETIGGFLDENLCRDYS